MAMNLRKLKGTGRIPQVERIKIDKDVPEILHNSVRFRMSTFGALRDRSLVNPNPNILHDNSSLFWQ